MLVIPATQEAKRGGSQSKANPDKSTRPYLKNKLTRKGSGYGSSGREIS
jgi:hypothetical protein